MEVVWLLILLLLSPLIFIVVGIVMAFYSDEAKRRKGKRFLIGRIGITS